MKNQTTRSLRSVPTAKAEQELRDKIDAIQDTTVVDFDKYNSIEAWREEKLLQLIQNEREKVLEDFRELFDEILIAHVSLSTHGAEYRERFNRIAALIQKEE